MFCSMFRVAILSVSVAAFGGFAQQAPKPPAAPAYPPAVVETGSNLFVQNCAFCHGRDAAGGEDGPDLTRSKVVTDDSGGDKIGPVVRNGRPQNGMPAFSSMTNSDVAALVAFIHTQKTLADSQNGKRRGVAPEDLRTGDAAAGKAYFNGAGGCSGCHSPTGDLKGIATRVEGLRLEQRLLYPRGAKSKATITTKSGQTVTGEIAYRDEFTISVRDANGRYHGFRTRDVTYKLDAPAEAHAELLGKYTDSDIHNLMAYLQSLK
jgi:cytochrome c oxidase cbb3-type subunit 3